MKTQNTSNTHKCQKTVRGLLSLAMSLSLVLSGTPIALAEGADGDDVAATMTIVDGEAPSGDPVVETPAGQVTDSESPADIGSEGQQDGEATQDVADPGAGTDATAGEESPTTDAGESDDATTDVVQPGDGQGAESSPIDEPADDQQAASVSFVLDHAVVTYGLGTVTADNNAISVNDGEAVSFSVTIDEGYELDEVEVASPAGDRVLQAAEDGTYVIDASLVHGLVTVTVTTHDATLSESAKRGYVYERANTEDTFTYETKLIKVTAKLSDPAELPEGVEFKVRAVTENSKKYNYDAYLEALNKQALEETRKAGLPDEESPSYTPEDTLLYDVGFFAQKADENGNPVEGKQVEVPLGQGTVELSFEFKKQQLEKTLDVVEDEDVEVVHLPLKAEVRDAVDSTADATKIKADDVLVEAPKADSVVADVDKERLDFTLTSLSLVALRSLAPAAEEEIEPIVVQKAYYGDDAQEGIFSFRMSEASVDENGNFRALNASYLNTLTSYNGEFAGNLAPVEFDVSPFLDNGTMPQDGTSHYIISENALDGYDIDQAKVLISVETTAGVPAVTYYALCEANGNVIDMTAEYLAGTQQAVLYNNAPVKVADSVALDSVNYVAYEPKIKKELRGGVLEADEFTFELVDADGRVVDTATNDMDGAVAFDALVFDEDDVDTTQSYTIQESVEGATKTSDGTYMKGDVAYSSETVTLDLTIDVDEETGALKVEDSYEGGDATASDGRKVLVNRSKSVVVRIVKRSRAKGNEPLAGAHYGLWMHNPDGADIYMGEGRNQVSDKGALYESNEAGEMYFDLPVTEGVAYYFREQGTPPKGHLLDPYPSDYFTLEYTETGGFKLTYEGDVGTRDEFLEYVAGIYKGN